MSFDDYAEYITQKFRLSTAIAIIQTKPENLTTEQYINELKDKINVKMDDDLDISVCSDDFNLNDDAMITDGLMNISDTILKDYNFENDLFQDVCNDNSMAELLQLSTPHFPENLTQTTHYETQANPNPITQADSNPIIDQADNDATYCDTIDIENIPINIIKDSTIDSQKTIPYTVYGYTQNTHYSPSQTNIIIPKGHIYGNNNNKGMSDNNTDVINDIQSRRDVNNDNFSFNYIPNMKEKDVINDNEEISTVHSSRNKQIVPIQNEVNDTNDKNVINDNERRFTKDASETNEILNINSKNPDSHKTLNNDINNSKNDTNESQNLNDSDVFNDNVRASNPIIALNSVNVKNINRNTEQSQHSKDISFFSQDYEENCYENIINLSINTYNSTNTDHIEFSHQYTDKVNTNAVLNKASNDLNDTHHIENSDNIITDKQVTESVPKATLTIENSQNIDLFSQNDEINDNDKVVNERETNRESNDNRQIMSTGEDTQEVIPFKVLEEFNKVKSFLSRNERRMSVDGYSTDSGYRSDSQSRASKSALQLSGNWLNQSGHCLFNHIAGCHLVVTTRDITNEIAQVLGQLIDKLHEEEQYPSFLDALLEANNVLLKQLCEGENSTENVLLNRDENIQRLILLNHSVHIQKFCIEKITAILTDYHSKLNDSEKVFELTNIDQIENLYYLFHILEILLNKYNKKKDLLSQASTQPSQDEIFKKSSITDLWKRKWNPNYQDGGAEGGCEKTCVLQVCCETLNKIIVDCFNSCSLVSYAALKCFNLTQS